MWSCYLAVQALQDNAFLKPNLTKDKNISYILKIFHYVPGPPQRRARCRCLS